MYLLLPQVRRAVNSFSLGSLMAIIQSPFRALLRREVNIGLVNKENIVQQKASLNLRWLELSYYPVFHSTESTIWSMSYSFLVISCDHPLSHWSPASVISTFPDTIYVLHMS